MVLRGADLLFVYDVEGFSFLSKCGASLLIVVVYVINVGSECCVSCVMSRMVGVMFSGEDCPFRAAGGCELDSCLSGVKRVTEDFCGDEDILFWVSHCSSHEM